MPLDGLVNVAIEPIAGGTGGGGEFGRQSGG